MTTVGIVIVNWNAGEHLRACLDSIAGASSTDVDISSVTVVDNASSDGSASSLGAFAFPLEVVRNDHNLGFAAACNQGARNSSADYLLFLNPDTQLFPDTLTRVTRFMESAAAEGVGICGVEVVGTDGRPAISCSRFPSLRTFFGAMTGLHALLPRIFPSHHLDSSETRSSRIVDQVIGAFYFVRRQLFEDLGGFDERYFMYFEDVDFTLRASRRHARSYFLKEARIIHAENVSSDQVPAARLYYSLRSRFVFARRHWSPGRTALLVGLTVTIELAARIAKGVVRRDTSLVRATISGYGRLFRDAAGGWRRPLAGRPGTGA